MRNLIKLSIMIILLPVVFVIGMVTLLAKVMTHASMFVISPVIFLCAGFSIYCAFEYGLLGFLIAISVSVAGFFILLTAFLLIEIVEGINSRLIGIIRS